LTNRFKATKVTAMYRTESVARTTKDIMDVASEIDPVDAHVGQRLRLARTLRGVSQQKLASLENLTFQQVQKYENGANRISSSRLYHLAQHLRLPLPWFFEGLPDPSAGAHNHTASLRLPATDDQETQHLLELFRFVGGSAKRKLILNILRSIVEIIRPDVCP
jgi:transcriptional regulator with XRE-family HTH domain